MQTHTQVIDYNTNSAKNCSSNIAGSFRCSCIHRVFLLTINKMGNFHLTVSLILLAFLILFVTKASYSALSQMPVMCQKYLNNFLASVHLNHPTFQCCLSLSQHSIHLSLIHSSKRIPSRYKKKYTPGIKEYKYRARVNSRFHSLKEYFSMTEKIQENSISINVSKTESFFDFGLIRKTPAL